LAKRVLLSLSLVVLAYHNATAAGESRHLSPIDHSAETDRRVIKDRLYPQKNPSHEDDSFLNAVGAVWPYAIDGSSARYSASTGHVAATGFLIDRCHILTNLHTAYSGDVIVNPPLGSPVTFAVGQTETDKDRGALQGLRFLLRGTVIAHGDAIVLDRLVHNPENDWAVARLANDADITITPMSIAAVARAQLTKDLRLFAAGFPTDHRTRRGDGFKLKDLWGSEGRVIGIDPDTDALIQTTIQTTPGDSGGPLYGDFGGKHLVIGLVQGYRGNGIDTGENMANVQILFTGDTLTAISQALTRSPCR
jgi:V8-like Glu-specific endopeptidase